ncbi:MAG: hypothetical protein JNG88_04095 [Phycisphaerales bacterium]|nr:hypothetical protein [Phycisphaerales bacterium]
MKKFLATLSLCAAFGAGAALAQNQPYFSEIYMNPTPGTDNGQEFIEIGGDANFDLSAYYIVIIEGDGTTAGIVDAVYSLVGQSTGANGLLLRRDAATVIQPGPDVGTNIWVADFTPDIENGSNTYILGFGTPPTAASDLDANDDCALDAGGLPGFTVVDAVSFAENDTGVNCEYADEIGGTALGAFTGFNPAVLYRLIDCGTGRPLASGSWAGGLTTGTNPGGPYNFDATRHFGWAAIGISDPSGISLNPGRINYLVGCVGRCCYGDGFCIVTTSADCSATYSGTYGGDGSVCALGACPSTRFGACCFAFDGTCQGNQSPGDCAAQGGVYNGDNTTCTPNPCPQPSGACCFPNGTCAVVDRDDCLAAAGAYVGNNTTCTPNPCSLAPVPVQGCDVAFGLSVLSAGSEHLARNGALVGTWPTSFATQSTEFDNCGGVLHNADGNLLALNFGSPLTTGCTDPAEGGVLYNLATDGSGLIQELYRFNTAAGGVACTRANGLSVSPDNTKIAVFGQDTGRVYILNYTAGPCGSGSGASVSALMDFGLFNAGFTQGTTWEDNDNVLFAGGDTFDGNLITVFRLSISGNSVTPVVSFPTRGTGSRFCDIEYRPDITPFMFVQQSAFTAGVSETQLVVIDPTGPSVIKTVILDTSSQTGREIAMGCDNTLVIGEFAGSTAPQPKIYADTLDLDVDNDGDIDAGDIAALTDNSSVNYYVLDGGPSSSFNGMDVATGSGSGDPCAGQLVADSNCDGSVNNFDIDCFVAAVVDQQNWIDLGCGANGCDYVCVNDANGDGAVNNFDIDSFVACVVGGGCP